MQAYLTTKQAAAIMGMGPHAVRLLVKEGRLAVHYLGPKHPPCKRSPVGHP